MKVTRYELRGINPNKEIKEPFVDLFPSLTSGHEYFKAYGRIEGMVDPFLGRHLKLVKIEETVVLSTDEKDETHGL